MFVFRIVYYGVLYSYVHKQNLISKSFLASNNLFQQTVIILLMLLSTTWRLCWLKVYMIAFLPWWVLWYSPTRGGAGPMGQLRKSRDTGMCFNQP